METEPVSPRLTVSEALAKVPGARRAILAHKMACIGCYMSGFCTLKDAASYYGQELDPFLREIEADSNLELTKSKENQ